MLPSLPSFIISKTDVPFLLGPLNGGLRWPVGFANEKKKEREWLIFLRKIYKFFPYKKSTISNAKAILANFDHTTSDIPFEMQYKVINFPGVGIDPLLFNMKQLRDENSVKKILFASRLVSYKMPDIILDAFIRIQILLKQKLLIVGGGTLKVSMEHKVKQYNLENVVTFLSWKTLKEVVEYMRQSDIFAYPTIRE